MKARIKIKRWAAWAPGAEDKSAWQAWACGELIFADEGAPALKQAPAMQRRRMSLLSKLALQVAHDCLSGASSAAPSVFASRHGEIVRTAGLLQSLAKKEPLSPTAFSMSVHNTSAGLHAILTTDTSPSTTVSAGKDSFCLGVAEAYSRSAHAGGEDVLLVYGDTVLPQPFEAYHDEKMVDHGLALLICANSDAPDFILSLREGSDSEPPDASLPHSLAFIRFLCRPDQVNLTLNSQQRQWRWSRAVARN